MARKRMIDPSIWQDDGMAEMTPRQQLLYIGLFSNADDEGRLKGSPTAIRLALPAVYGGVDLGEIEADRDAVLQQMRRLRLYVVDGRAYLVFSNYAQWQRIDKPSPSVLPVPPEPSDMTPRAVADDSPNVPRTVLPNRKEEKLSEQKEKGIEENGRSAAPARAREPDPLFEAVIQVCYEKPAAELTDDERGRTNKALPQLRRINATPGDVLRRGAEYRSRSPDFPLTPQTLTKSWTDLGKPRAPTVNGRLPSRAERNEAAIDNWSRRMSETGANGATRSL